MAICICLLSVILIGLTWRTESLKREIAIQSERIDSLERDLELTWRELEQMAGDK